jgi:tRNA/rRNA methyltransferase
MLENILIVLCNTSHNGNIGAAARAMKTMGISNLVLVNPVALLDDHAIALACNAADIVKNAKIVDSLDTAISDATITIGMTSRKREYTPHLSTPKEIIPEIFSQINGGKKIAIVFGSEKYGLSIEELEKCNRLVTIPGNPDYFSLNLAQAVQIMCYEIYSNYNNSLAHLEQTVNLATFADNQGILNHLEQVLKLSRYHYKDEERTRRRLQNILNKASLEREDVDLLRGMLKTIEAKLSTNLI